MRSLMIDGDTAERLLSGLVAPDDAPPGYAEVAGLLRSCARLSPPDRTHEQATVGAMVEGIRSRPHANPPARGRVAVRRPTRIRLVSTAVGVMLVGTSGLAFAGELPAPAQRVAHTMFSSVGFDIPTPDDPATTDRVPDGSEPQTSRVGAPAGTKGDPLHDVATDHAGVGRHGAAVSSQASHGHSYAGRPHGRSHEPHEQSAQPHGQSGEPHGQPEEPHGRSDAEHPSKEGDIDV